MAEYSELVSYEKKCYSASHNWFREDGVDFTLVEGISIGNILQLQVFEKLYEGAQVNADRDDLRSLLKKINMEWTVRAIASKFDFKSDNSQADILFVYDVNNAPMIEALNAIGSSLEERGKDVCAVTIDRKVASQCNLSRKISWFKYFSSMDFFRSIRLYLKLKNSSSESLRNCYLILRERFGLEKAKKILRYFKFQSPQVLMEIAAISSLLEAKKPSAVVLASDAHRVARTFVFLSKSLNIKTVVYQHGATIWEYGYVPVYADWMLVWGPFAREWFEARGVDSDKLVEIGNLRSDVEGYRSLVAEDFCEKRKIYFFTNPIDRSITAKVINMMTDICKRYELEGVIKLHPSEKNIQFFKDEIKQSGCNIKIKTCSLDQAGVMPGDVAIVVNSTAGIDCCLKGAYVLNVVVDSIPNSVDYESGGVGIRTSLEDFILDFERLIELPVSEYLLNRSQFVGRHLGKLDGNVQKRASDFVSALARNER